ncbi:uncharacterized protein LOC6639378 [Drosophila willistoni]|uniref:uncharacterized protein LOC6639378 n=1 Tax=Drosophila willistoni TaxID=7260 RepID=UPI00017D6AF4|nr:uncharacterized protein LOC6639378 [Drosophila willistoni]
MAYTHSIRDSERFSIRKFWREFLAVYQQMPELWDVDHANYRNKELKNKAYNILEVKLREVQPNATRSDVGRRINIFRTNYRREQLRLMKQKELGLHGDLCKPSLWFYHDMEFLSHGQATFQHKAKRGRAKAKANFDSTKDNTLDAMSHWSAKDIALNSPNPQSEDSSLLSPKIEIIEDDVEKEEFMQIDINQNDGNGSSSCVIQHDGSGSDNAMTPFNEAKSWNIPCEAHKQPSSNCTARETKANNCTEQPKSLPDDNFLVCPKMEILEQDDGVVAKASLPPGGTTTMTVIKGTTDSNSASINGNPGTLLSEASEILAKSWAIQYEEMAPTQRILARKAIADILFEGCMGNLRINRGEQRNTVDNH